MNYIEINEWPVHSFRSFQIVIFWKNAFFCEFKQNQKRSCSLVVLLIEPLHITLILWMSNSLVILLIESLPITFILWYQSLLINMHDITLFGTGWIVWLVYLGMSGVCHCFNTNTSTELTYKSLLNLLIYSHETEKNQL